MNWFESAARALIIAAAVLIGATIVRNVTDALTMAAGDPVWTQTANR